MNKNELVDVSKNLTMEIIYSGDFQKELINLERKTKEMENLLKQVKDELKKFMDKEQLNKIEGKHMTIVYVSPIVKDGVDNKQILIDHPEFEQMYPKKTFVSGYITLKAK